MLDTYGNILQTAVLLACSIFSVYKAVKFRSRSWTVLSFFYGCWMLGDVYWLACLIFYKNTPQISTISDLSWYAAQIFLYLLLRYTWPPEELKGIHPVSWLAPVFTAGMAVFFMFWGEIISNLVYAALMGLLLFASTRRIADKKAAGPKRFLPVTILVYVLLEYGLWVASCLWDDSLLFQPYYVFDLMITASFPVFLHAVRKAVTV